MFGIFLFFATVIGGVGMSGELPNTPSYTECLSVGPAYVCEAEHGNSGGGEFDRPGRPAPDPEPDDDQCDDDNDDQDSKPGHGHGDKRDHSGPPGLNK